MQYNAEVEPPQIAPQASLTLSQSVSLGFSGTLSHSPVLLPSEPSTETSHQPLDVHWVAPLPPVQNLRMIMRCICR